MGTLIILSNFLACQWNVEGAGGPGWWGDGKGFFFFFFSFTLCFS